MSLGFGEGGESQAPLGRAVIGGLTTSTFITLFLIPVSYLLIFRRDERRRLAAMARAADGSLGRPARDGQGHGQGPEPSPAARVKTSLDEA
jgi:hypothetical protein